MHLSYSSLKDKHDCGFRFKLKHIDKVPTFQSSIDTVFGTLVHQCIQKYLSEERDQKQARAYFVKRWQKLYQVYKKYLDVKKVKRYLLAAINIIGHLDECFDGWELVAVEELLMEPVSENHKDVDFKGFLDLVMTKNGRLAIADLKTTKTTWAFNRFLTEMSQLQLIYYKTYYSQKHNVDLDDIDLYYITLEKTPTSKQPIQFLCQPYDRNLVKKSENLLESTIHDIQINEYSKNREACVNNGIKCPFFETEHCT